jgi:hypothetical protein
LIIKTGGTKMNRKLFRMMTLVVTVLLALAITVPALADPLKVVVLQWDEDGPTLTDCDEDGVVEIWLYIHYNWQVRYEYDENGELVPIIFHSVDKWHVYNNLHPELFINGMIEGTGHLTKTNGGWGTGVNMNFHAPGYPQLAHISGYMTLDEDGNTVVEHGRWIDANSDLFCELLTPP